MSTATTATTAQPAPDQRPARPDHEIVVIGAGLSGIGMGIALRREGIDDFVILERADNVGGTWRDNTYPGVGVDIPAQAYQFSYELKPDWSAVFALGGEVQQYVEHCTDRYGIRPRIRFNTEVTRRTWDEEDQLWRLQTPGGEVTARFVISAIGPFVEPKPSGIPGVDDFEGKLLQSARWDHDYDLSGKRVAIIGTGASAVQIIPKIAPAVARLDVYQRTPIWVAPRPNFPIPGPLKALYRRVPLTQKLTRKLSIAAVEGILIDMVVSGPRGTRFARIAEQLMSKLWYPLQVRDRELRRALTPEYGFGCKRPAVSNQYLRSFTRDNVELITERIERITATGVETSGGELREVDALVLATGFHLATDPEPYRRSPVRGRDGFDLADFYENNRALAYEGISMPGLPNHFIMFGPYGWTGGTWHELVESTSAHIIRVVTEAQRRRATEVEVKEEAASRWTDFVRERMGRSLWNTNNCGPANSYYFDRHGDTPFLRPTRAAQAHRAARTFPLEDYAFRNGGRGRARVTPPE